MKKLISLLLVCTIAASGMLLCACGNEDNKDKQKSSSQTADTTFAAKSTADQSENAEVDLMKLHGISDNIENDFAGSWQIIDGEGKQYKDFVYMFDGTTEAILMTGSVGHIAVYSVEDKTDDKGNKQTVFTAQMVFGINGKYTFKFSADKQQVVLTSLDDNKTTTMKKLASYEYIPIPDSNPKISKNLLGAWKGDDGEMMYFNESGIMYDVMTGINFYFATYSADGKKASWTYSYSNSKIKKESAEYSVKGDTLTFNGHDYKRVSPSELI